MKSLKTNANNDIFFSRGKLAEVKDADAIAESCAHIAKAVRGEIIFDIKRGLPYEETIFSPRHNIPLFLAHLKKALLSVEGVTGCSVSWAQVGSELQYFAEVATIYGRRSIDGKL